MTLSISCRPASGSGAPDGCRIVPVALCSNECDVNTTPTPPRVALLFQLHGWEWHATPVGQDLKVAAHTRLERKE